MYFKQVKYKWGIFFWASTLFLLHPLLLKRSFLISLHLCLSQTDVLQYTYSAYVFSIRIQLAYRDACICIYVFHVDSITCTSAHLHVNTLAHIDEIHFKFFYTKQVTQLICGQPRSHVLLSIFRCVQRRSPNMCTQCVHAVEMYECMYVCMYVYCLLYTSPSPRDLSTSRMPSSA